MSDTTLRLQSNVPETIALEFADGLPVASRFGGDQVMFSLCDGRKLYLSPYVADKIAAAGIGARQPFTLCKREVTNGNRRTIDYQIEAAAAANGAGPAATEPAPVVRNTPQTQQRSVTPSAPPSSLPSQAAATPAPVTATTPGALMTAAGRAAVDAVLEIERYAQSRGMTDFAFGADNLQAIAVSLFIAMDRKGGRA